MDAGNGKSRDFGLFKTIANQVVRKGVCRVPRFCGLLSPFRPLFPARWNGHSAYLLTSDYCGSPIRRSRSA